MSEEQMTHSNHVMNPSWDIFDEELMDTSTVEREYVEYREQNVANTKTLTKYEIETKDKDSFIEMHSGFLECKYRLTTDQQNTVAIQPNDKIALQNHGLSLFKNVEVLLEDQRVDYLDDPAVAWTIKNVTDFSRQYGESIASAEGFYLDTNRHSTLKNCNLRFFNLGTAGLVVTASARTGVELFFKQVNVRNNAGASIAFGLTPTVAASLTTWQVGDVVVALLDSSYPTPGGNAGGSGNGVVISANYPNLVNFTYSAVAAFGTKTAAPYFQILNRKDNNVINTVQLLVPTDGNGAAVGAATNIIEASLQNTAEKINFFISRAGVALPDSPELDISKVLTVVADTVPELFLSAGTLGAADDTFIGGTMNPDNYNQGFQKRYLQAIRSASTNTSTGQYHSLWIPLKNISLFYRAYDKITRGIRHRLVLNRNADNLALLRHGATPNRYFSLEYVSMWVPRLKPSLQVLKSIEQKLVEGHNYTVNFTDLTSWRSNVILASAGTQVAYQLATSSKKPIRIYVAFQLQSRYEGDQITNKRVFDHLDTTAIQVRLNQQLFPLYEYKFDYTAAAGYLPTGSVTGAQELLNYQRAYNALLSSAYKNRDSMDGSMITYEQFKETYPIYYFDLTCQSEDLYRDQKYAEIDIRWTNQSLQNYYAYVVYESERQLQFKGIDGKFAMKL